MVECETAPGFVEAVFHGRIKRTVIAMPKRVNPRRRPATMADVQRAKDTATADACRVTLAFSAEMARQERTIDDLRQQLSFLQQAMQDAGV